MTALAVLNAERIKLSTTRAPVWIAAAVAALSLAVAALQGAVASGGGPVEPQRAALGIAVFGVPVLMVLASMTVTAEYRSGTIRTTFIATPNRTLVLLAKAIVAVVFSAVFAAVMVVLSVYVAALLTTPSITASSSVSSPEVWPLAGTVGLYAALAAVLGVGVGAVLRAGPGAVAVLLLWPLVAEPMLGNLPDVGPRIGPYLPFANAFLVTEVPWLYPSYAMPWGPLGSLAYFVVLVAVVFSIALVVVNARDA